MTNCEQIKNTINNMSIEEITSKLSKLSYKLCHDYDSCDCCPLRKFRYNICNKSGFINWLKSKVEK